MRFSPLRAVAAASLLTFSASLFGGPKIGVLLKAQDIPFWKAVEQGATQAGKELGADVTVKAPLKESDISVQIRLLNAMAGQGMQAIVIAPINKEALARPIASIAVTGVKIVVIDTAITGNAAPVFIGTDQQAAGKAGGALVASLITDKDEVAFFKHSQASGATMDRDAGALTGFRSARPNAIIHGDIYASSEPGLEKQKAELLLKEYPHVKAILATGTAGTLAMLDVLKAQNLAGSIKLVGFGFNLTPDVASAIESGALTGWIAQLPKEMGSKGVATAVSLLKGETVAPVINTDFVVITKDNLKEPKVQALLAM